MKILNYIFEKDSPLKLIISLFVVLLSLVGVQFSNMNEIIYLILGAPFALWLLLYLLISILFAWVINPITFLIKKYKK